MQDLIFLDVVDVVVILGGLNVWENLVYSTETAPFTRISHQIAIAMQTLVWDSDESAQQWKLYTSNVLCGCKYLQNASLKSIPERKNL